MLDHYLLTATEAKFVTNKPHILIIECSTQRYECMIKISEAKIKRRSNDTQVIESHSLSSDVSLSITSSSWMYNVRTKGGKTAGRPPQQYIQMKRMGVYRITSIYDVTAVSLRVGDVTYELPHWTPEEHPSRMASLPTSPTSRSRAVMPREQYLHECKETTPIRRVAQNELPHQPRKKKIKVDEKMEHVMIPTSSTSSTWIPSSEHTSPVSTTSTPSPSELIESTPMTYGLDFQLASVSQTTDQLWYTVPSSHIHGLLSPHYPNPHQQPLFSDELDVDGYGSMLDGWKPSEQVDDFVGSLFAPPLSPHEDMGMEIQDMTHGLQVDVSPQSITSPSPSSSPTSPGLSQPPVTRSFSSLSFSSDSDLSLEEQLDQRLDELVDSVVGTGTGSGEMDMNMNTSMSLLDQIQVQDIQPQPQAYVFQAQQPVEYIPPQIQAQTQTQTEQFVFYPPIQSVMQPQFAAVQSYQQHVQQQQTMVRSFSPGPSLIPQQHVQVQVSSGTGQQQQQQVQMQAHVSPGTEQAQSQEQQVQVQQIQVQISPGIQQLQEQQPQQIQAQIASGMQQEQHPQVQISPYTQQQPVQVQASPGTGTGQPQQQISPGPQHFRGIGQEQQQVQAQALSDAGTGIGMVFHQQLAISPTSPLSQTIPYQISSGGGSLPLDGLQIGLVTQHVIMEEAGTSVPTSLTSQSQHIPLHDTSQSVSSHTLDTSQLQSENQLVYVDSSHDVIRTADAAGAQSRQLTTFDTSQSITQVSQVTTTDTLQPVSTISPDIVTQRVSMVDTSIPSITSSVGSDVQEYIPRTNDTTTQRFMSTMLALSILPNILHLGTRDGDTDDDGNQHSRMVHHSASELGYQQTDTNVVSLSQSQSMSQFQNDQQIQLQTQANAVQQVQDFMQQSMVSQRSSQDIQQSTQASQVQDIQQSTQATQLDISSDSTMASTSQQSSQAQRVEMVSQSIAISQSQLQNPSLAVTTLISPRTISQQAQAQAQTSVSQVQTQANISQQTQSQVQAQNGLLQESTISVSEASIPILQENALSAQGRTPAMIMLSPLSLSSPLISQVQAQAGSQVMLSTSVVDTVLSSAVLASPSLPMLQTDVTSHQDIQSSQVFSHPDTASLQSSAQVSSSTRSHQTSSQSPSTNQLSHVSSPQASTTQAAASLSTSATLITPLSLSSTPLVHASSIPIQQTQVYDTIDYITISNMKQLMGLSMLMVSIMTSLIMMRYKQMKQDGDEQIDTQLQSIHQAIDDTQQQQSSVEIQPQPSTRIHDGSNPHPCTNLQFTPIQTQVSDDPNVILISHVISSIMVMIIHVISNIWQHSSQLSVVPGIDNSYPSCSTVGISTLSSHSTAISSHTTSSSPSQMPSASLTTLIDAICMLMSRRVNLDIISLKSKSKSANSSKSSSFNSSQQPFLPSCPRDRIVSHSVVAA